VGEPSHLSISLSILCYSMWNLGITYTQVPISKWIGFLKVIHQLPLNFHVMLFLIFPQHFCITWSSCWKICNHLRSSCRFEIGDGDVTTDPRIWMSCQET